MKKYVMCIFEIFCLFAAFHSQAENQINECNCLSALRGYNRIYRNAWVGTCTEKSHPNSYPYYLMSASIKSKMISDPSYYSEYYHNLQVFNESLVNYLNYKLNECEKYPTLYGKDINVIRDKYLKAIEANDEADQYMRDRARMIYESCYRRRHLNPMTLYDNGLLEFVEGNTDKSAEIAEKYIRVCKERNIDHQSSPAELMLLGQSYIEMAQYSQAIEVLSDLIQKEPTNKAAYFHRATAYFETGNFDGALADFLSSDEGREIPKSTTIASKEFTQALITSICQGASESAIDFVPSFCGSAHGLSTTLWAIHWSTNPFNPDVLNNVKNFANTSYEMGKCVINYCKNIDAEIIDGYVDQIKILYQHYDRLNDTQKGELIGYTMGRYGVDIFAGATATAGAKYINKVVPLFRNLRDLNRLCNLEAMCVSEAEKKAIVASSLTHAAERETYFKTVKINWDKQNKHIPSEHNFLPDRGKILIEKAELETLAKKYAGTGQRVSGPILEANYKERVDFGKIIGEYALMEEGRPVKYFPTSKGIITYAKDGSMHVWPSDPGAIIK